MISLVSEYKEREGAARARGCFLTGGRFLPTRIARWIAPYLERRGWRWRRCRIRA